MARTGGTGARRRAADGGAFARATVLVALWAMSATTPNAPVPRIDVQAVQAARTRTPAPLLVDVREEWEFAQGHIEGAAWMPLSRLPEVDAEVLANKARPIVTYCHHGVRSQRAAAFLLAQGFSDVSSMDGGIDAWAVQVDPSLGRY